MWCENFFAKNARATYFLKKIITSVLGIQCYVTFETFLYYTLCYYLIRFMKNYRLRVKFIRHLLFDLFMLHGRIRNIKL